MILLDRQLAFRLPLLRGEDVRRAQLALLRAGEAPGEPDGVFGPHTAEAVRRFQRREGIPPDGIVGPRTWERLAGHPALRHARPWAEALRPFLASLAQWHGVPLGDGARRWRLARGGVTVEGEGAPRRNRGLRAARAAWEQHRVPLAAAALRFGVPVELLLAALLAPPAEGGGSGLLHTPLEAAREALNEPALAPADLEDPARAAAAGAALIRRQALTGPAPTRFDPPLVAIAFAEGALRPDADPRNPWGLGQPRRADGTWHADAFLAAFGDAHALFVAGAPPPPDIPSLWELLA